MKTVINIKTDKETKEKAQKLAAELGINISVLINAYLRQFIREKSFSFSLSYEPTPYLEKILDEAEKDIAAGKNMSPVFDNDEDMISFLRTPENERKFS